MPASFTRRGGGGGGGGGGVNWAAKLINAGSQIDAGGMARTREHAGGGGGGGGKLGCKANKRRVSNRCWGHGTYARTYVLT